MAPDGQGMYVIGGRLPAEVGAAVMRAIEVAAYALLTSDAEERPPEAAPGRRPADGAETRLDNLLLLCRFHHRKVHEEAGGWSSGAGTTIPPDPRVDVRPLEGVGLPERPVEALVERNRRRGADPDGWELLPRHPRGRDVLRELDARAFGALEATSGE